DQRWHDDLVRCDDGAPVERGTEKPGRPQNGDPVRSYRVKSGQCLAYPRVGAHQIKGVKMHVRRNERSALADGSLDVLDKPAGTPPRNRYTAVVDPVSHDAFYSGRVSSIATRGTSSIGAPVALLTMKLFRDAPSFWYSVTVHSGWPAHHSRHA